MKRTVICSLPFKSNVEKVFYDGSKMHMPVAEREVYFPINALLEANLKESDEIKMILVIKVDKNDFYEKNKALFLEELKNITEPLNIDIEVDCIYTKFSQERLVHEKLMGELVDKIEDGSHIVVDITYGPKDLPIIIFSTLNFADKYLGCEIDCIIYGLAQFDENNHVVEAEICDMSPLFYLNSVSDSINGEAPGRARELLKLLLSL